MSLINVGDHEILWEKDSISLDERYFMACCTIQWEKRGLCQFPIRSFEIAYGKADANMIRITCLNYALELAINDELLLLTG